jgi:hypothetical protein
MNVDRIGAAAAWIWLQAAAQQSPGETPRERAPGDPAGPTRAEVAEAVQVPATLSSLHCLATTWLPPRVMPLPQDQEGGDRDAARSNDEAPFDEGHETPAFEPAPQGVTHPSTGPGYRELTHLLHLGGRFAALRDLATQRRVLVLCAAPVNGAPMRALSGREKPWGRALRAHLLWTDVRGVGQVRSFSARWSGRTAPVPPQGGWWEWRCHREQTERGISMRPQRDRAHQLPVIRLTGAADADSAAQTAAGSLDLIDARWLLHLMGTQWSLRVVVAPEQGS